MPNAGKTACRGHGLLLAACIALSTACNGGNTLHGSASDLFPLAFDTLVLLNQPPFLVIEYAKDKEIACKVTVNTPGLGLKDGSEVSGADFLQKTTVSRVAKDGKTFDKPLSGTISFSKFSTQTGGTLTGRFDILLTGGFTLIGDFSGQLKTP